MKKSKLPGETVEREMSVRNRRRKVKTESFSKIYREKTNKRRRNKSLYNNQSNLRRKDLEEENFSYPMGQSRPKSKILQKIG